MYLQVFEQYQTESKIRADVPVFQFVYLECFVDTGNVIKNLVCGCVSSTIYKVTETLDFGMIVAYIPTELRSNGNDWNNKSTDGGQ